MGGEGAKNMADEAGYKSSDCACPAAALERAHYHVFDIRDK